MRKTEAQLLVIFGASGDLTVRKLIPALFHLYQAGQLPENFAVLGASRSDLSDEAFRKRVIYDNPHLEEEIEKLSEQEVNTFADHLFYQDLGGAYDLSYDPLKKKIESLQDSHNLGGNTIYYLSTPPTIFETIAKNLTLANLNNQKDGWKRLIVEKPFGYSLDTAQKLNSGLQQYFAENQIYRIDHYLGKETVQNLLITRFANSIFEPLWNRNYIHHVEITNAESGGVEKRGGYYEKSGALRDMFQNHLLQIVSLIVMEPPITDAPEDIRNEKVKALKSLRTMKDHDVLASHTIRAQYGPSEINGQSIKGYREEEGVAVDSTTETFAAVKFYVDNWRWRDVPFYVRTAKRMPTKVTEAVIHFKTPPHQIFEDSGMNHKDNKLIIRIQPDEGILIKFGVKVPGQGFLVERANLDFYYSSLVNTDIMEAYERLLLDAMQGDATLYARADEVEAAWEFVDPILDYWKSSKDARMYGYAAGVWGPENADELIEGIGFWRNPGPNLTDDPGYCVIC